MGATTTGESIALIAECLNRAHAATTSVVTVLENMVNQTGCHWRYLTSILQAGSGHIIGSDFSHLADIIVAVENKARVGVCLDTCRSPFVYNYRG